MQKMNDGRFKTVLILFLDFFVDVVKVGFLQTIPSELLNGCRIL